MKFCLHCYHALEDTIKIIMTPSYCKIQKEVVDYYQWDKKCCRCGKVKTVRDVYEPFWYVLRKIK